MPPDISFDNYYKVKKKINQVEFLPDYFKDTSIKFR